MKHSEVEPNAVFSPDQWDGIAQSICIDQVPLAIKHEICDALFAYDMGRIAVRNDDPDDDGKRKSKRRKKRLKVGLDAKEHDALEQFVCEARSFRRALYRLQEVLPPFDPIIEPAERLGEDVYQLQRHVDGKLEARPRSKGGRPSEQIRDGLIFRLVYIYAELTGEQIPKFIVSR